MKKFSLLYAVMAVMLLSAFAVSAAVTTVNTFDSANPTFGGENQAASNPKHDVVADRNKILSAQPVILKNTDTVPVTIDPTKTQITYVSPFTSIDSNLQVENTANIDLTANGQATINFKVRISEKLDAVNIDGDLIAIKVATVTLFDNSTTPIILGSFDVYVQRENNLEMNNLDANIEGGRKKSLSDDDTLENLKPGDNIEIEAEARNNYGSETNVDVENVVLEIECTNDKNLDISDKSVDIGDISTEDEQTDALTVDIEADAEDKTSDCIIKVIGRDQNGARHGEGTNFAFEITRESHDIQITAATVNPTSVSCTDREVQLTVDLLNLGRSNENRVALEVTSKAISFQERVSNIELDEDDSTQEIFVIPMDGTKIKPGPFAIQVQSFYDNTKSSSTETIQVDNLCNAGSDNTGNNGNGNEEIIEGAITLDSDNIKVNMGGSASIPIKITNLEKVPVEYMVALADISEFAETSTSKSVFLNPGQQSTILLNLKSKAKVDAGKYSGIIVLKDSTGKTLETKTFTVDIAAKQGSSFDLGSVFGGADSRVFWIIGDIILIIVAIFFIRLIFTGGKKKQANKKLADYEAEMSRKKPSRRRK